jgi:hypothetical protein
MNKIFGKNSRFLLVIVSILIFNLLPLIGQNLDFKRYSNWDVENSDAYKVGNIYQKDLLLCMEILKESHPAFAPGLDAPFNIDSINQAGYLWASKCQSVTNLWTYLQAIMTLLNDGHTSLMPDLDRNHIYPFELFKENKNIYLKGVTKEYGSFLGKQISLINGHAVLEVINSFRPVISSDNEVNFSAKVGSLMRFYSLWKYTPYCLSDSSLQFRFADATTISLHQIPTRKMNLTSLQSKTQSNQITQNDNQHFQYKLLPEKNICYLQFLDCTDQSSMRYDYYSGKSTNISVEDFEKKISRIPRFDTFLTEMFQTIEATKIKTLVIDVRGNGGGNSSLCDVLLSWLKPLKDIKNGSSSIRISKLWEQNYPAFAAEYKQGLEKRQHPYEIGKLYDTSSLSGSTSGKKNSTASKEKPSVTKKIEEYFIKNTDENKVFKGNVVFIQDAGTFSSAGLLITKATDNNIGIVIGDKSSFRPCNYGDLLAWELPNTKIKGFVSHKIFERPNTTKCHDLTLIPDVYLTQNWSEVSVGKDICWEWILNHYGK